VFAGGIAAWVGTREGRRKTADLLATTPRAAWSRLSVALAGTLCWLLLAYGLYFPNNRVMLIFPPIPMPARVFVVLYAALELFLGVTGTQAGVAHFAHLGGMIGGWLMLRYWRGGAAGYRR